MIHTVAVEYPGLESIIENSKVYKDKLINESVIVFRGANLSLDEQKEFHKTISKIFGFKIYGEDNSYYTENHINNPKVNVVGSDDIMLGWHIEHVHYLNPIVLGTWNMFHLTSTYGSGKTYFVDTSIVYNMLDKEVKDFLNSCTLQRVLLDSLNSSYEKFEYKAIAKHWITGLPVIRIPMFSGSDSPLIYINGKVPTDKDHEKFKEILKNISNIIKNDTNIRISHTWEQGDLVVMDAFKLAHAVTGGFDPKDREFTGMWGHRDLI